MKKLVNIAENSDSIEDGQRPNCRLKIKHHNNRRCDWTIDKLLHLGTVHTTLVMGKPDAKKWVLTFVTFIRGP